MDVILHSPRYSGERLWQSIQTVLEETALCSLATLDGRGRVHVNTAFFAWTPDLVLYFLSDPASQHCRNLAQTPTAAVAVFDSHQMWGAPHRGLQLEGTAGPVTTTGAAEAERTYASRFQHYTEFRARSEAGFMDLRLYCFRTVRLQVLDEEAFEVARPVPVEVRRRET